MDARHDPFESALRSVLQDRARVALPADGLGSMLDEVMAGGRSRGVPRAVRWVGALAAIAASVLVIVALGVSSRPGGSIWSVGGDGDDGPAILWDSGRASLEADSIRIVALGTFTGTPDVVNGAPRLSIHTDPGSPTYRTLEVEWQEQGLPLRLYIYFAADDTHWWVTEMRTYDGSSQGEWIYYPGPLFRTPLGSTYVGDFAATGQRGNVPGSLRIDGLQLTAFAPGTGPAPFTGCRPWTEGAGLSAPADLEGMRPAQATSVLRAEGVCHFFRWGFRTGPDTFSSERWCRPPPTGVVESVDVLDDGTLMVWVEDDTGVVREERAQPIAGWGCPTDQRGAASAGPMVDAPSGGPSPAAPEGPDGTAGPDGSVGPRSITVVAEPVVSPGP